jgi:hypothetical protein
MNHFFRIIGACLIASLLSACGSATSPPAALAQQDASSATQHVFSASGVRPDNRIGGSGAGYSGGPCVKIVSFNDYTYFISFEPPGCYYHYPPFPFYDGVAHDTTSSAKAWFVGQAVSASANQIVEYSDKWKEVATLTGLTGVPIGIMLDSKGDVWSTNSPSNTISEYAKGSTTPTATYTDDNMSSISYVASDKANDVYVSGQGKSGNLEVDEFQGSSFAPIKTITGSVGGGIAVASGKTLWVCDEGTGTKGTISSYTIPGFKRREQFAHSGSDTGLAVTASGKQLWAINNVPAGSQFHVSVVIYSVKGKVLLTGPGSNSREESVGIAILK